MSSRVTEGATKVKKKMGKVKRKEYEGERESERRCKR